MKRLLSVLCLALAFSLPTACSGPQEKETTEKTQPEETEPEETEAEETGGEEAQPEETEAEETGGEAVAVAGDPTAGEAVYMAKCKGCHGTLAAPGKIGPALAEEPWEEEEFRAEAKTTITEGKSTDAWKASMPAFAEKLSEAEIDNVIAYLAQ